MRILSSSCLVLLLFAQTIQAQSLERKIYSSAGDQALIGLTSYSYTFGEPFIGTDLTSLPSLTMGFHQPIPLSLLAVHSLEANGTWEEDLAVLSWTTDAFVPRSWFQIERSENGIDFLPISELDQHAQSTYSLTDEDSKWLSSSTLYYRISWMDATGLMIGSEVLKLRKPGNTQDYFEIFPNPADQFVNFRIAVQDPSPTDVLLFDAIGGLVWQKSIAAPISSELYQIPLANFAAGTYILNIRTTSTTHTQRLVIAH